MNIESVSYWRKALLRDLSRLGFTYTDGYVVPHADSLPREQKMMVWLRESLLWTIGELESGRHVEALRGLLQASSYAGVCGHCSVTGDAFIIMRNYLEDILGKRA